MKTALTERQWQDWVASLARACGWRVSHFAGGWSSRGFRTACRYDGQGFPDLVLAHPVRERVLFVELKAGRGKLSEQQEEWRDTLRLSGAEYRLWRPEDEADVVREIGGGRIR